MLILAELQKPEAGLGEILVQVHAAGVTPTELLWYPTTHTKLGTARIHAVPGHEFSGVIAAIGKDVQDFEVGDEVYGMNDWFVMEPLRSSVLRCPRILRGSPQP